MKKVYQTVFDNVYGNCLSACIASMLELDIGDVPNPWEETQDPIEFYKILNRWLEREHGHRLVVVEFDDKRSYIVDGMEYINIGKNGQCCHAVIVKDGEVAHNPNKRDTKFKIGNVAAILFPVNQGHAVL